jgi:hypothetical protein
VEKARTDGARAPRPATAAATTHKPRRRTYQDEVTPPRGKPPLTAPAATSIWDDLDEDTRVLSGKSVAAAPVTMAPQAAPNPAAPAAPQPAPDAPVDDAIEQAFELLKNGGQPRDEITSVAHAIPAPPPTQRQILEEATSDGEPSSHGTRVWSQPPELAQQARGPAAQKPLATLPALRVAVLGTSARGEVRLITLDGTDEPPPGAALAVLVPLSAADGEAVERLFRGHD